jgi:serine protease
MAMRKPWIGLGLVVAMTIGLSSWLGTLITPATLQIPAEVSSVVVDFREDRADRIPAQLQALAKLGLTAKLNSEFSLADHIYLVEGDRQALATWLSREPRSTLAQEVESIAPNYLYQSFAAPNDPGYSSQWNLHVSNVEPAWDQTKGKGITVAVIDTGISPVPDLEGVTFAKGYDFVNDREAALDDNGHGTHVAGTIAQATNNNYGVAGIAYEATLMPLKVLSGEGGGTVADIAEAIRFAADHGADVINLSLGGSGESPLMQEAIDYAYNKGLVVVAAAGNRGASSADYPARYRHAMGVAALDSSGEKTPYSNYGAGVDLAAPGGLIRTDEAGTESGGIVQETIGPEGKSQLAGFQGTSMAAPHVAGAAALVKAMGIQEPDQVVAILRRSARMVTDDGLNYYGAGKLDIGNAVSLASQGQITWRDFLRWLRDSGYLNPRFWIDGGTIAILPKLAMVLGSYVFAWWLRVYAPFGVASGAARAVGLGAWGHAGLIWGSCGLFGLRMIEIFDAPQWPLRVLGSSLPELGGAAWGNALNPVTASVLLPLGFAALLLGNPQGRQWTIGVSLGTAACLGVSALVGPHLMWVGPGGLARLFLGGNALLCLGLAALIVQPQTPRSAE